MTVLKYRDYSMIQRENLNTYYRGFRRRVFCNLELYIYYLFKFNAYKFALFRFIFRYRFHKLFESQMDVIPNLSLPLIPNASNFFLYA